VIWERLDEEAAGLDEGLEHHDAGEDGEGGEVVLEILLGAGDVLEGDDAVVGEGEDAVDEIELHGGGM